MPIRAVGLLSPGDMGHVVGRVLLDRGVSVKTCLEDRSKGTQKRARQAGIGAVPNYVQLVRDTDLILSILVPAEAKKVAETVAQALVEAGEQTVYVDCNAVAPATARSIAQTIEGTGSRFVDAGIIGPPPIQEGTTRFYASGADANEFQALSKFGLDVVVVGTKIGQASGLKMTYAALTKGTAALSVELLVAAWRMGLYEALLKEFQLSQSDRYASMERALPKLPSKARRWVGEMEEIAKTFGDLGLTPKIYQGAADMYRFVGETQLADETEGLDKSRTLDQMVEILTRTLEEQG